jgi:hypothetical protein
VSGVRAWSRVRSWYGVEQYVLYRKLIEVEIFIQIKATDGCSDVQKIFSVVGNDGGNIMYKIKLRSTQKNTSVKKFWEILG